MSGQPIAYGKSILVHDSGTNPNVEDWSPSVSALADGTFVVVWQYGEYWSYKVVGQVLNADGTLLGSSDYLSPGDGYPQTAPVVAGFNPPGATSVEYAFAYTNTAWGGTSPYYEVRVIGTAETGFFTANEATNRFEFSPAIAVLDNGNYVVAWISATTDDPAAYSIVGEVYTPGQGATGGGNITLNVPDLDTYRPTRVSLAAVDGGFVVVAQYEANDTDSVDGSGTAIVWRMFDDDGAETDAGGVLNTTTSGDQYDPSVAGLAGGGWVAVWTDNTGDSDGSCVKMRIFTPGEGSDPGTLSSEILVNTTTAGWQDRGMVTALADGSFVVAFESHASGVDSILLQTFSGEGVKIGKEVTVTTSLADEEIRSITTLADGRVVVSWSDENHDILARIFDPRTEAIHFAGTDLNDNWVGTLFADTLAGGNGGDRLRGNAGDDQVVGGIGDDFLFGDKGSDHIRGDAGLDRISGGLGKDFLTGGADADTFAYRSIAETGKITSTADLIRDFVHNLDEIDLSAIDANGGLKGEGKFKFLAKPGAAFTGVHGQLHWYKVDKPGTVNDRTVIEGDTNGDRKVDFHIELVGLKLLTAGDFVL